MAVDVVTQIEINRPLTQVAAYTANPDNAPSWYENIKSVEWKSDPPVRVGTRVAFVAQFMGRRIAYTYEVTELIPDEQMVMRTAEGPFPMETTYTWVSTPSGSTWMLLRNRGEPKGFPRLMAPLVMRAVRRANEKDLARLKAILEAGRSTP